MFLTSLLPASQPASPYRPVIINAEEIPVAWTLDDSKMRGNRVEGAI